MLITNLPGRRCAVSLLCALVVLNVGMSVIFYIWVDWRHRHTHICRRVPMFRRSFYIWVHTYIYLEDFTTVSPTEVAESCMESHPSDLTIRLGKVGQDAAYLSKMLLDVMNIGCCAPGHPSTHLAAPSTPVLLLDVMNLGCCAPSMSVWRIFKNTMNIVWRISLRHPTQRFFWKSH